MTAHGGGGDLNAQALAWCEGPACDRRWPEGDRLTVRQALQAEQASLMGLPEHECPVAERVQVHAGKTPYVRFDLNDYSIPPTHVRRTLTVLAEPDRVRVLDGAAGFQREKDAERLDPAVET